MNKLEKLLKKISRSDREKLLSIIFDLVSKNHKNLNIIKLSGSDLYRCRSGSYRIIFHYEKGEVIIDSIKNRDDNTYNHL
jgi:hypothetical protein